MYQSPRTRRLRNDFAALDRLRSESSVFRFTTHGDPPQLYHIVFKGKGLWRDRGKIKILDIHRVEIKLGSSYPRTIPEIRWVTPIYHPNISEIGMVCLGGYGTHWVPSVQLDELCVMLWDMVRYHNYDIRSPYNRDAALWVANQATFLFPVDGRALRDLRAALGRALTAAAAEPPGSAPQAETNGVTRRRVSPPPEFDSQSQLARVRQFIQALERSAHRSSDGRRRDRPRQVALMRQLINRFFLYMNDGAVFLSESSQGPNRQVLINDPVRPAPEARNGAIALGDSSRRAGPNERVDITTLEGAVTPDERPDLAIVERAVTIGPEPVPEPERPSPGADEIIFID
jgi:ubiquitin-protein ligase